VTDLVFVHSSFRTGSSWFRSKFRSSDTALVFGEIFHEALATIDAQSAVSLGPFSGNLRHPATAPYFVEFAPLIATSGGIPEFSEDMAFECFFPADGEISEREERYIALLLDRARSLGKFPVLTCTRSLGRMQSIKRKFGGTHILLTRDPFRQWCSYTEQGAVGNPYFLSTNGWILKAARAAGWLRFGNEDGAEDFLSTHAFYQHALLHLKLYNEAAFDADITVDYDQLKRKDHREEIRGKILESSGIALDLSDFRPSNQFSLVSLPSGKLLDEALRPFMPARDQMHPDAVSLYEAMHASIESYEREARELVSFSRRKLSEIATANDQLQNVQSELDSATSKAEAARTELDRRQSELTEARAQATAAADALANAEASRAVLQSELSNSARDHADQLEILSKERRAAEEDLRRQLDESRAATMATQTDLTRAQADGLAIANELVAVTREHAARIDRDSRDRQAAELDLRTKLDDARATTASAQIELARFEERVISLGNTLQRQDEDQARRLRENEELLATRAAQFERVREAYAQSRSALIQADVLIRSARTRMTSRWQSLTKLLGLSRNHHALHALAAWSLPAAMNLDVPPTPEKAEEERKVAMQDQTKPGRPNPYLRVDSLTELLAWHDVDFVRCAYVTILGRQPDPQGEAYYTNRIRAGRSKLEALWQLRRSHEGSHHDPGIAGLDRELKRAAWRRKPIIGRLIRVFTGGDADDRLARYHRSIINQLGTIRQDLTQLQNGSLPPTASDERPEIADKTVTDRILQDLSPAARFTFELMTEQKAP
jgi:hypothetical protein